MKDLLSGLSNSHSLDDSFEYSNFNKPIPKRIGGIRRVIEAAGREKEALATVAVPTEVKNTPVEETDDVKNSSAETSFEKDKSSSKSSSKSKSRKEEVESDEEEETTSKKFLGMPKAVGISVVVGVPVLIGLGIFLYFKFKK
jgi:cobalamin biosynthesis Mg chelatase CobN